MRFADSSDQPPPLEPACSTPAQAGDLLGHAVATLAVAGVSGSTLLGVRRGDGILVTADVGVTTDAGALVVITTTRTDRQTILSTALRANLAEAIDARILYDQPHQDHAYFLDLGTRMHQQPTRASRLVIDDVDHHAVELTIDGYRGIAAQLPRVNIAVAGAEADVTTGMALTWLTGP